MRKIGLSTLIVVGIGALFAYAIGGSSFFIGVAGTCGAVILGALGAFVVGRILGLEAKPDDHNTPETHESNDEIDEYDSAQMPVHD